MSWPLRRYWKETRQPIYSAALVLPFFLIYHIGTFFLQTTYINGADALIIRILRPLSVNTMFASALVLLVCFVIWQVRTRASWTIDTSKLLVMYIESLVLALLLLFLFGWFSSWSLAAQSRASAHSRLANLVLYCGAGIYEELLFRAFLLGGLLLFLNKVIGLKQVPAALYATILAALIFSLFHYIGAAGDPFTYRSFLHRTFAGIYFSAIFVTRGFGVAAASHALYDIVVGIS